jgi:Na+/proline symporter
MKAVLWTDTFQAGVILAGLLAVVIRGSMVVGGFGAAWDIANKGGPSNVTRIVFWE